MRHGGVLKRITTKKQPASTNPKLLVFDSHMYAVSPSPQERRRVVFMLSMVMIVLSVMRSVPVSVHAVTSSSRDCVSVSDIRVICRAMLVRRISRLIVLRNERTNEHLMERLPKMGIG